jgi:hypothetical protein
VAVAAEDLGIRYRLHAAHPAHTSCGAPNPATGW